MTTLALFFVGYVAFYYFGTESCFIGTFFLGVTFGRLQLSE